MGLTDAWGPADEERVVGLSGHLGDRQGGGVGESVGVTDDELIERELGVAQWPNVRGHVRGRATRLRLLCMRRSGRATSVAGRGDRAGVGRGRGRADELDDGPSPQDELRARLDYPAEARLDPALRVRRGLDQETVTGELERAQGRQPDAIGGLVDREGELGLHPRPYVLELVAHGSVDRPLLPEAGDRNYSKEGPAEARFSDYI